MESPTILIEARPYCASDQSAFQTLKQLDAKIIDMRGKGTNDDDFNQVLEWTTIILAGNDLQINTELIEKTPNLKMIGKYGVGLDTVDLDACSAKGIVVCNSPGCNSQSVADQAMSMLLGLFRRIPYGDASLRAGKYEHAAIIGREVWGKTMGIVGLGSIGRAVAERANGFRMKLIGFDPYWPDAFAEQYDISRVGSISDMLPEVDVLTLHCNLSAENHNMIDANELKMMRRDAVIINTARGGLINEKALYDALKSGEIAGAAIDAWAEEPPTSSPLLTLDNVLAMPHSAAFTVEAFQNMDRSVTEQIIDFCSGRQPRFIANKVKTAAA